jgi:hypothetical protein
MKLYGAIVHGIMTKVMGLCCVCVNTMLWLLALCACAAVHFYRPHSSGICPHICNPSSPPLTTCGLIAVLHVQRTTGGRNQCYSERLGWHFQNTEAERHSTSQKAVPPARQHKQVSTLTLIAWKKT